MASLLCRILLFCSPCLVTAVTKQLGKMETLQNVLESVCWGYNPAVPNYYDQFAFSWTYLAFYSWLGWMLLGLCEVLAAAGGVIHSVCGCFINESRCQRESTERWSNPESAHPCDDAESCLLGRRLFKRLSVLGTGCSSRQTVRGRGVQQPPCKNVKPSPGAWCSGYCRASAPSLGEQSTDLLPHPEGREWVLLGTCVGGQEWGTQARGSADSFSFQVCCHHGTEDRNSLAVALKILLRAEAWKDVIREGDVFPGRCPESPLSGQNAGYAWWNPSRVFLQHFGGISSFGHHLGVKSPLSFSG